MTWRRRFRSNPEIAFQFGLAEKLGKSVAELETGRPQGLSGDELCGWIVYYELRTELQTRATNRLKNAQERQALIAQYRRT